MKSRKGLARDGIDTSIATFNVSSSFKRGRTGQKSMLGARLCPLACLFSLPLLAASLPVPTPLCTNGKRTQVFLLDPAAYVLELFSLFVFFSFCTARICFDRWAKFDSQSVNVSSYNMYEHIAYNYKLHRLVCDGIKFVLFLHLGFSVKALFKSKTNNCLSSPIGAMMSENATVP